MFEEKKDKIKIIYKIQELSSEEKRNIVIEGARDELNISKNIENEEKVILKNKLTEFKSERFEIKDIKKLYNDRNISTTIILKDIIKIINQKNQKYSIIRDIDKINNLIINFDDSMNVSNTDSFFIYSNSSSLLQNIVSNLVREKILVYN